MSSHELSASSRSRSGSSSVSLSVHRSLLTGDEMSTSDSSFHQLGPMMTDTTRALKQPLVEQLRREEEEEQWKKQRERARGSSTSTTSGVSAVMANTSEAPIPSATSFQLLRSSGSIIEDRTARRSILSSASSSTSSSSYVPPTFLSSADDALANDVAHVNGQGREMRSTSFSAYSFAPLPSASAHVRDLDRNSSINVNEDDGQETDATATGLERAVLSSHSEHEGPPLPLLLAYKKSGSSIRKDFTTVDWFFARSQMHRMRRLLLETNRGHGWQGKVKNLILAAQGWIVLLLVGCLTALSASVIHSVSALFSDWKTGYCSGHTIFATRRVCCMDEQTEGTVCQAWTPWTNTVGNNGSPGAWVWAGFLYIVFATLFAYLATWICCVFARQAAGSGIAELKIVLGGFIIKKFLGIRTLFFKTIGLTLAVASGMALGKEGPMVHIACAWGHILSRPFLKYNTNEVKKREILSASVAAGVTAAFGAPLGGVLFSLEVCSSYFPPKTMWRAFWCAVCTAVILGTIDPFQTGKLVQFSISIKHWHWFELFPLMMLGAIGGMAGALFIRLNVRFTQFRKSNRWLRARPTIEVAIIAFVTAILSFPNIFARGNSGSLLAQLFTNCQDIDIADEDDFNAGEQSVLHALCMHDESPLGNMAWIMFACVVKFLLTTVTYGSAIPSGVFMPSLVIGGLFGRVIGWAMLEWHRSIGDTFIFTICAGKTNCINPALYAVIGAASMLGGVTRMTVSLAVIMYEVTGGLDIIVPMMVGVVFAKWFGDAFGKASLYGQLIELNGLPHIDPHEELDMTNPAAECMTQDPVCLTTYGQTVESLNQLLANEVYHGFPIIDNATDRLITGFIARSDLEYELEKVQSNSVDRDRHALTRCHFSREPPPFPSPDYFDFSNSVDRYPIQVRPSMPIDRIMTLFQSIGLRYLLCCSPRGRIMGIIKKKDILLWLQSHNIHHR